MIIEIKKEFDNKEYLLNNGFLFFIKAINISISDKNNNMISGSNLINMIDTINFFNNDNIISQTFKNYIKCYNADKNIQITDTINIEPYLDIKNLKLNNDNLMNNRLDIFFDKQHINQISYILIDVIIGSYMLCKVNPGDYSTRTAYVPYQNICVINTIELNYETFENIKENVKIGNVKIHLNFIRESDSMYIVFEKNTCDITNIFVCCAVEIMLDIKKLDIDGYMWKITLPSSIPFEYYVSGYNIILNLNMSAKTNIEIYNISKTPINITKNEMKIINNGKNLNI
jgi:hypothetical protein